MNVETKRFRAGDVRRNRRVTEEAFDEVTYPWRLAAYPAEPDQTTLVVRR